MTRHLGNLAWTLPARSSGVHLLARDATFCASDCVCLHGVRSPAFSGQHRRARVSVLLAGTFQARSSRGTLLAGAGTLLLGNARDAYEYRHVDDGGDRSVVFDYEETLLDAAAHSLGVRLRAVRPFRGAAVPASAASTGAVVLAQLALRTQDPEAMREAALAALAVAMEAEGAPVARPPPPSHARRVARALRHVEAELTGDCSLDALAACAGMSPFHFLRVFRALTGQTPRQVVIAARLRRAALALRASAAPVTAAALDAGFGDLSHFNLRFKQAFGVSPRAYRARGASPRT